MKDRFHPSRMGRRGHSLAVMWAFGPLVAVWVGFSGPVAAQEGADEREAWARERVPGVITGLASSLIETDILVADQLVLAASMLEVAVSVDPDYLPAWQKQAQLGTAVMDDLDMGDAYAARAIENIVRLDPGNQVARLRQILTRIEARPTAEGRVRGYERFLVPEAIDAIGTQTAARIAFDLALLHRRMGDTAAYARKLALSVELDPTFPIATATAAGFFRVFAMEPAAEAELLIAAVTADPLDGALVRALGELLIRHGAFRGAADILPLALELTPVRSPNRGPIVEDTVLALWGTGRRKQALAVLDSEQRLHASMLLAKLQQADPLTDRHEFLETDPPPGPRLAFVKAVILADQSDATEGAAYMEVLERAFGHAWTTMGGDLAAAEAADNMQAVAAIKGAIAALRPEEAWVRVVFNLELSKVPDLIDQALSDGTIDTGKAAVIRGWFAFQEGRLVEARELLEPAANQSPFATAGLALVERAEGNLKNSARMLLHVYRTEPGTLLGLWCRGKLGRILGRTIAPLEGGRLLSRLVATMPRSVGRIIRSPQSTLSVSILADKNPFEYDEPLRITVRLRNSAGIPLSIGAGCPISPTIALVPDITVAGIPQFQADPLIIAAHRKFQIPANGEVDYAIDLAATPFGLILNSLSLPGATMQLRVVINFRVVQENITAGLFDEQATSLPIRMEGAMETNDAIAELNNRIARVSSRDSQMSLAEIGILSQYLSIQTSWMDAFRGQVVSAITTAFAEVGPLSKAWLLTQLPTSVAGLSRLIDNAVATDDPAVFAVLFSRWTTEPGAAPIVVGSRSSNAIIRKMAASAQNSAELLEILRRRQFDLGDEGKTGDGP